MTILKEVSNSLLLEFVAENTQRNKQKFYANTPFNKP